MSSSQYITLEEFTSSPPPSTILLPRSHALRLLELCELAEMASPSNSSNANYFIGIESSNDSSSNSGGGGVVPNPHVLVTQMALLLYLGEYTHARHLWRRHRRLGASTPPSTSATTTTPTKSEDNERSGATVNDDDYAQLESLWEAAKYCYLWSTGGIFSLTSNSNNNNMQEVENTNDVMQDNGVGNDSGSSATSPFSTLALRALQACQSKKIEPLSTYSAELIGVIRSRVNKGLHTSFDKLDCNEFRLRMNIEESSGCDGEGKDGEEQKVWESFGWKKQEGGYLVSDVDDIVLDDYEVGETGEGMTGKDRIGKLTEIVMFLEGKMNA